MRIDEKTRNLNAIVNRLRNKNSSSNEWYHIQTGICELTSITREDFEDLQLIFALDWSQPAPTGLEHAESIEAGRQWNDIIRKRKGPRTQKKWK